MQQYKLGACCDRQMKHQQQFTKVVIDQLHCFNNSGFVAPVVLNFQSKQEEFAIS